VSPPESPSIATHLVLPSWWVHAYEAATMAEAVGAGAMEQATLAGLAPALSPLELNALAVVIAGLQEQLLSGGARGGRGLVVTSDEHLRHASTAVKSRRFTFEKVVQLLPGLRLLRESAEGELRSFRLFAEDAWVRRGDSFGVELAPSALGPELVLGFSDAHADLVRAGRGEPEGGVLLAGLPPLVLWRSIWLELQGIEQAVFMRMERGMQWDFRWLQLEGVFGVPMGSLFAGLDGDDGLDGSKGVAEARARSSRGEGLESAEAGRRGHLEKRLRLAARLGRKLCSHGFLSMAVDGQFLAVDGEDDGELHLVWQVARERLASTAAASYRAAVARYMLDDRVAAHSDAILRVLLPEGAGADTLQAARELWAAVSAVPVTAEQLVSTSVLPGQTLLPQVLFVEFCLRRAAEGVLGLPDAVLAGPVAELTEAGAAAPGERFERFLRYLDDAPEVAQTLPNVARATLASTVSKQDADVARHVRAVFRSPTPYVPQSSAAAPSAATSQPAAAAESPKPRLVSATLQAGEAPPASAADSQPVDGDAVGRKGALSGALASRMRRIAADELQKMRESAPERYRELKTTYLTTLDDVGRRLILDVQKRMQPTMFEEHLRQRLVRFMVDNPGAWRSSEARPAVASTPLP
jgi:hypothetical protein